MSVTFFKTLTMFGIQNLLVFLVAAISLNLLPGANTLYIIARSIAQGRKAGMVSVLGINTGLLLHTNNRGNFYLFGY